MRAFTYQRPSTLAEARSLSTTDRRRTAYMAGGTDLLGTMKDDIHNEYPEVVIDLKGIGGLSSISVESDRLKIGAMTTLHELSTSPVVNELCPMIAQAVLSVAFPEIRQKGTVGGNICQESRCWYYRYPGPEGFHCLRKGGDRCFAILGENDLHSVFGSARVGTPPCEAYCPIGTSVPAYLADVRENEIGVAARKIFSVNPFAAITGRVCPHFCQNRCNRGDADASVNIRNVERYVGDYILEHGEQFFTPPRTSNGKHVAVVGSGPAGLTVAYYLTLSGCRVTVFEKDPAAGGMLYYGVPEFRLPKRILSRFLALLEAMGIGFRLSEEIGTGVSIEELKQEHDLVFLGPGAAFNNTSGIPGEEHAESGLAFLRKAIATPPDLTGKRVAVIGGGNVAIDCARTAVRCGASQTHLVYRRSQREMPAYAEEVEEAEREGVMFDFLRAPVGVTTEDGRTKGLELITMELGESDSSGRKSTHPVRGSEEFHRFDVVIMAIGQKMDRSLLLHAGIKANRKGYIEASKNELSTSDPSIHAGGDAVNDGPRTVVETVISGKNAAAAMATAMGIRLVEPDASEDFPSLIGCADAALDESSPVPMPTVETSDRHLDTEDALGLDGAGARAEAMRCINCSCVDVTASDLAPVLTALGAEITTTERTVPAEHFFHVGINATTVLKRGEIVTKIAIPLSAADNGKRHVQRYVKYRVRKSIDFPRAGIALNMLLQGTMVEEVRIVFGAVAPVPYRARAAERFLTGNSLTPATIAKAGELCLEGSQALRRNGYKLPLLQVYLTRMLSDASSQQAG